MAYGRVVVRPCSAAEVRSSDAPGVVWFGETLDLNQIERVETFLQAHACDLVLVIGTTAMFGYIVDWATRAAGSTGRLIEVNPDPTPLSRCAGQSIRGRAGAVLPQLVDELLAGQY